MSDHLCSLCVVGAQQAGEKMHTVNDCFISEVMINCNDGKTCFLTNWKTILLTFLLKHNCILQELTIK